MRTRNIIGPFMERDFIYTPLIILNFPMTDFKTVPLCSKMRLLVAAIGSKNNTSACGDEDKEEDVLRNNKK